MVGQHNAPCPHTDRLGLGCNMPHHHRRRRTGDAGHIVMLGQPVAMIAPAFGLLRQIGGMAQCIAGGLAFDHGGEIEH